MSYLLEDALTQGLITRIELTRQDDDGLHFTAHGSAPGQRRIIYEKQGSPTRLQLLFWSDSPPSPL